MYDIDIAQDGELMIARIQGETEAGVEFVDSYMPGSSIEMVVHDSGMIFLPQDAVPHFLAEAAKSGISVVMADVTT